MNFCVLTFLLSCIDILVGKFFLPCIFFLPSFFWGGALWMVHVISHAIQVDNLFHRAGLGVNLLNSSLSFTTLCRAWIELIMHGMLILFCFSAWQSQLLLVVTVLLHCQFSSTRWIFCRQEFSMLFLIYLGIWDHMSFIFSEDRLYFMLVREFSE